MRNVFPKRRSIDRGDEAFVHPRRLPLIPEFRLEELCYSTFAPDFVPAWALPGMRALERLLESSPLAPFSIHYVARLRKASPIRQVRPPAPV
jgi:hypothetical protein